MISLALYKSTWLRVTRPPILGNDSRTRDSRASQLAGAATTDGTYSPVRARA
jgi:hypothetical protein